MTEGERKGMARGRVGRGRLWAALFLAAAVVGLLSWWAWPRPGRPTAEVPHVPLDEAEPVVRQLVEKMQEKVYREPGSAHAWGVLGQVLLVNGYERQAIACLEEAERLDSSDPRWPYLRAWRLILVDRDQALPLLRRAVQLCERDGDHNPNPRLTLVDALLEKGELQEAEQHLERVLAQEPENPRALVDRGLVALQRDDLALADRCFRRASTSPYTQQKAFAQLAVVCQRRGSAREAAEYARKASELPGDPTWPDPYLAEAEQWAVGLQARFLEAERMERQGHLPEGIKQLSQIAEDFPSDRSQAALGVALAKVKDYDSAEKLFRAAIRQAPEKLANYYGLAVVLFGQGENYQRQGDLEAARAKFREAAEWARKTIERKPDHALAHVYLGLALKQLGRRKEAIVSLVNAVRCRPELVEGHLRLGEALAEDGQTTRALASLNTAAELAGKDDDRPRAALARLRAAQQRPK